MSWRIDTHTYRVVSLKTYSVYNRVCNFLDADFLIFPHCGRISHNQSIHIHKHTRKDDRFDVVIFTQHPDEKLGEVVGIDKLPEWLPCSGYDKWCVVL